MITFIPIARPDVRAGSSTPEDPSIPGPARSARVGVLSCHDLEELSRSTAAVVAAVEDLDTLPGRPREIWHASGNPSEVRDLIASSPSILPSVAEVAVSTRTRLGRDKVGDGR